MDEPNLKVQTRKKCGNRFVILRAGYAPVVIECCLSRFTTKSTEDSAEARVMIGEKILKPFAPNAILPSTTKSVPFHRKES